MRLLTLIAALMLNVPLAFSAGDGDVSTESIPEATPMDSGSTEPLQVSVPDPSPVKASTPIEDIPVDRRPTIKSWIKGDSNIGLGKTLIYKVVIRRKSQDRIHLPADTSFGGLDIVEKELVTSEPEDGWVTDDYTMTLLALTPGEVDIAPLEFGGVLEKGEVVKLETHARKVTVTDPTEGAKSDEPKDIAPVVDVFQEDYTLLWVLGGLALAALIALLVWYMARNWDRWHPRASLAPPPPRPPEEVALEKLDDLKEDGLPASGEKKGWYITLSEIMREYVGGRYGFDGLESTTEEIIHTMRGIKTAGLTQAELFGFLNECDMVKFAKYEPGEREDEEAIDEAYRIVRVTTPNILPPSSLPPKLTDGGAEP